MKVPSVTSIREKTGLSQPRFAELFGVSVRTLQEWEQAGERHRVPPGHSCSSRTRTPTHSLMWPDNSLDVGSLIAYRRTGGAGAGAICGRRPAGSDHGKKGRDQVPLASIHGSIARGGSWQSRPVVDTVTSGHMVRHFRPRGGRRTTFAPRIGLFRKELISERPTICQVVAGG